MSRLSVFFAVFFVAAQARAAIYETENQVSCRLDLAGAIVSVGTLQVGDVFAPFGVKNNSFEPLIPKGTFMVVSRVEHDSIVEIEYRPVSLDNFRSSVFPVPLKSNDSVRYTNSPRRLLDQFVDLLGSAVIQDRMLMVRDRPIERPLESWKGFKVGTVLQFGKETKVIVQISNSSLATLVPLDVHPYGHSLGNPQAIALGIRNEKIETPEIVGQLFVSGNHIDLNGIGQTVDVARIIEARKKAAADEIDHVAVPYIVGFVPKTTGDGQK